MEENSFLKITNAVYRILDFLPDNDPLKTKGKEKALAILENMTLVSGAKGWISLQKEKASAQLLDDISVLKSYLEIGRRQGWIDGVNFLIITKAYDELKQGINPPKGLIRQSLEIAASVTVKDSQQTIKNDARKIDANKNVDAGSGKPVTIEKYSERQKRILEILSQKEGAQVADLIKELPNITKRTVRRDLDDLLKRGKIVRVGEWNRVLYKKADRTEIPVIKLS